MPSAHNIHVLCVPPDKLQEMWPHMGHFLVKGQLLVSKGDREHALKEIAQGINKVNANLMQVWVILDEDEGKIVSALTTEILFDPEKNRRVVWVSRMAGEHILRWGKKLTDTIEGFAKAEGASHVCFVGRPALLKAYARIKVIGDAGDGMSIYEGAVA